MCKVILIDDESHNGWKDIIEKVLFNNQPIDSASDHNSAVGLLTTIKYDLIFLDLRFGQEDHIDRRVKNFGGYKLLNEYIRKSFYSINFSTPIILFTASNKIWNVISMLDQGADSYYIKEHPDTSFDLDFSRNNFIRLKKDVPEMIKLGFERNLVWDLCQNIITIAKTNILNSNIKNRITEKLLIGYAHLFNKPNQFTYNKLIHNKDELSFIVFWSILEEISSDFFNKRDEFDVNWILRKNKTQIQYEDSPGITYSKFNSITLEFNDFEKLENIQRGNKINLSNQIAAILRYQLNWNHQQIHTHFLRKLNKYRNDIDFIHSSIDAIRNKSLKTHQDSIYSFTKCIQIFKFLIKVLN